MNHLKTGLVIAFTAVAAVTFLPSCHTGHSLSAASTSHRKGHEPQFLDGIKLGSNSNSLRTNVGGRNGKKPYSETQLPVCDKYAYMMGVVPTMLNNNNLYRFIDEWYGVQYHLGGHDKTGIDCSAFAQQLYDKVFGVSLLRTAAEQFTTTIVKHGTNNLREGDLVFFHTRGKRISHVGIYLINNFFVHASVSQGVMISNLNEAYWQHAYAGAGEVCSNKQQITSY